MKIVGVCEADSTHYIGAQQVMNAAGFPGADVFTMRVPREVLQEKVRAYDHIICFGKKPLQYLVHKKLPPHKLCRRLHSNHGTDLPIMTTTLSGKSFQSRFAFQMVQDVKWGVWMAGRDWTPLRYKEIDQFKSFSKDFLGFDLETNRLEYWAQDATIVVASLGSRDEMYTPSQPGFLAERLLDPNLTIVGHNLKFDFNWWTSWIGDIKCKLFDTEVAHALTNDNVYDNALGFLSSRLGYDYHKLMVDYGTSMADQEFSKVKSLNQVDVAASEHAGCSLKVSLEAKELTPIFDFVMELIPVFSRMECRGIRIDQDYHGQLLTDYAARLAKMRSCFPDKMDPDKPQKVRNWLYDDMELPRLVRTKTGLDSVDKTTLERLRNHFQYQEYVDADPIKALLDYRAAKKMESTYILPMKEYIQYDGRVHASWNLCAGEMGGVKSGRTSCRNPNLQNIPSGSIIRPMFCASPGYSWGDADYSGLEIVVQADLSGDETMVGMIERGEDYHTFTMSDFYKVPVPEIEGILEDHDHTDYHKFKDMRRKIKIRNFLIQYGGGAKTLAEALGTTQYEAGEMIAAWYEMFPGVTYWQNQVEKETRSCGYSISPTGRRRTLPDINLSGWKQWRARRQAINHRVQSFASDLTLTAMYLLDRHIRNQQLAAYLLLNVHDQIAWEQETSDPYDIMVIVDKIMTLEVPKEVERRFGHKMSVPLTIDAHKGERWS